MMGERLYLISFLVWVGIMFPLATASSQTKMELEIPEIVIGTSSPELMKGHKDQVGWYDAQTPVRIVTDTVTRPAAEFPEVLEVLDSPKLESKKSCMAPCLNSPLAVALGPEGRFAAASKAIKNSDFEKAVSLLTPVALKNHPESPKALYFVGRCKQQIPDLPGAANAYEMLRRTYPDSLYSEYAGYLLGWIYLQNNNTDRAIEIIDWFKEQYPASVLTPYARYLKAAIQYARMEYSSALESLEGIVAGYPLFPHLPLVQFWIAENQFFLARYDQALNNYSLYLQNFPEGERAADALYGRAYCHLSQQEYTEATSDLSRLTSQFPQHRLSGSASYLAAKISLLLQDDAGAIRHFQNVLSASQSDQAIQTAARAWLEFESKNYEPAKKLFELFIEQHPFDAQKYEMMFMAGVCAFHMNAFHDSIVVFRQLAEQEGHHLVFASWANAGIAYLKMNNPEEAYECFNQAMRIQSNEGTRDLYSVYASESLYRLGRYQESLRLLETIQTDRLPESMRSEVLRSRAWCYYSLKQWKPASALFGEYASRYRTSKYRPESLLRQAESFFNMSEYANAREQFGDLIKTYPIHPEAIEARLLIARIDWVHEDYDAARQAMQETLKYAQNALDRQRVHITMGDLERELGNYSLAIELYDLAYKDAPRSPKSTEALLKKGDGFYNMERYPEAADIYRSIIDDYPESPEAITAQYSIGLTYFQQNKIEDFFIECDRIAERYPGSQQGALALVAAAEMLSEQKRFEEAIRIYRRLMVQFSEKTDMQQIRLRLAQALENNKEITSAKTEYEALIQQYPHGLFSADAALSLGRIALQSDDLATAIEKYSYAADNFPLHPRIGEALLKLAELYRRTGRDESARQILEKMIRDCPDSKDLPAAKTSLAELLVEIKDCIPAMLILKETSGSADPFLAAKSLFLEARCMEIQNSLQDALTAYLKVSYLYSGQQSISFQSLMHAGDILVQQEKAREALRVYEKARDIAVSPSEKQAVKDRLASINPSGGTR